ncbi:MULTISPECIES: hypothetical protein [unclassified Devosia]|uniref:hypothetical protein n=1 Tax=unclassified Devosia TaxID=196773 RepID=UPI00086E7B34|nr:MULTISPECIES: hypothetical protein [unclassified Devosia]MBN9360673.1 hypothetical protein [Devosia sp.]ODS85545.1 MAG: hypothetical protein ABS47_16650 [Devosia sp. SCN 66-27]OJX22643.1 MAG: hypothetical protein BGO83_17770 [Devosia sp. 66-14]
MEQLMVVLGVFQLGAIPALLVSAILAVIGRVVPVGTPSRIWLVTYSVALGACWMAMLAYWFWYAGLDPDNHITGEAFLAGAFVSCGLVPLTIGAVVGTVWRNATA